MKRSFVSRQAYASSAMAGSALSALELERLERPLYEVLSRQRNSLFFDYQ